MPRSTSQRRAAMRAVLAAAAIVHLAAGAATASPSIYTSAPSTSASSASSSSSSDVRPSISVTAAANSGSLLERIGHFLSSYLPDERQWNGDAEDGTSGGGGGLFGDGGSSLAWGGSTLEVVKTQASYLTRPAAFGPHIHSDEGLRGLLLPISDYYKGRDHENPKFAQEKDDKTDNHGCPYKGGPGWRDQDYDNDDGDHGISEDKETEIKGAAATSQVEGQHTFLSPTSSDTNDEVVTRPKPPKDWIALVERGGECAFAAKVRVAQALGATAVVIGDAPSPDYSDAPNAEGDPGLAGRLVTMFAPGDTSDIKIPSTFITRPSYVDLIRLIDSETQDAARQCEKMRHEGKECQTSDGVDVSAKRGVEVVLWRDDVMWEWPLIDLAFILLLLPSFMTLVTIVVHRIRMIRQRRKDRAPELAVLNLPCLIWRPNGQPWEKVEDGEPDAGAKSSTRRQAGSAQADNSGIAGTAASRHADDVELGAQEEGAAIPGPSRAQPSKTPATSPGPVPQEPEARTYYSCDECAICLSEFVDGERVRILPCGHVFHVPEIDSWLLRVKKLCPICKRDITVPIPPSVPAPALAVLEPQQQQARAEEEHVAEEEAGEENAPLLRREV